MRSTRPTSPEQPGDPGPPAADPVNEDLPPVTGQRSKFIPGHAEAAGAGVPAFLDNITTRGECAAHGTAGLQWTLIPRRPAARPTIRASSSSRRCRPPVARPPRLLPGSQHMIDGKKFDEDPGRYQDGHAEHGRGMADRELRRPTRRRRSHPFHIHVNPFQIVEIFDPNQTVRRPMATARATNTCPTHSRMTSASSARSIRTTGSPGSTATTPDRRGRRVSGGTSSRFRRPNSRHRHVPDTVPGHLPHAQPLRRLPRRVCDPLSHPGARGSRHDGDRRAQGADRCAPSLRSAAERIIRLERARLWARRARPWTARR